MKTKAFVATALLMAWGLAWGQTAGDFESASAILKEEVHARSTVKSGFKVKDVKVQKKNLLDLNFGESLSDYSWTGADVAWLRSEIERLWPESLAAYKLGEIFCESVNINELIVEKPNVNGIPVKYAYGVKDPFAKVTPLVQEIGAPSYAKGLSGRHISLWQSHGRYYSPEDDCWQWQRSLNHRTCEDMYTQSYVIPFLIPMLENAGAYVMTPRERDTQIFESVCDNDPSFTRRPSGYDKPVRTLGSYTEFGAWSSAGTGFADSKQYYSGNDNPFEMGTARQAACVKAGREATAYASWKPSIKTPGAYAVYVSYKTVEGSTDCAHYTVHHKAGVSQFSVNQQIGGGTWIYLGTFEFDKDNAGVTLDNAVPAGRKYRKGSVVTADAVRFGGGMGKIVRGPEDAPVETYTASGYPAFVEGAMYWMQWAGVTPDVYKQWEDDYTIDYAARGAWTSWMLKDKGVPFDLSLAFHTDAGITPNDSTVGTLSIYTLMANDSRKTYKGIDRMSGRLLANYVQDEICNDIRADFDSKWNRRQLWNRSYSESRTTEVPGMLLELLSHQNFGDMKLGLDPSFRFTVSRAIYKGMLKTISQLYGVPFVVQPLPVNGFGATLTAEGKALLQWTPAMDEKEPTAVPSGYLVQTRIDNGVFDAGFCVSEPSATVDIEPGHVYSFKVTAFNEGGKSFPSEVLAVGKASGNRGTVLIVNNFDRLSAPAYLDSPTLAGFCGHIDCGVSYGQEINYVGETYDFLRNDPWKANTSPGAGANHFEYAGKKLAGNTFDFVALHGKALLELGYDFVSQSHRAFEAAGCPDGVCAIDLLCGKQITTKVGRGEVANRYHVFPAELQEQLRKSAAKGINLIVNGANIASDAWYPIYELTGEDEYMKSAQEFCSNVLGYKFHTYYGSFTGKVHSFKNAIPLRYELSIVSKPNPKVYCVENPDGIDPASDKAKTVLRYTGNEVGAAVFFQGNGYRSASFGFPFETVKDSRSVKKLFEGCFSYFESKD